MLDPALWWHLTNWGNSILMMPTALAIALGLWLQDRRGLAGRWSLAFASAVLVTLATKVAFLGWCVGSRALDFTGISGHSMLASSVLTVLAWWVARSFRTSARVVVVAIGVGVALTVAASRLVLDLHSASEVVAGLALGFATAALTLVATRASVMRRRWLSWVVLVALVIAFAWPLERAVVEEPHGLVERIALALSGRMTVYTRADLHEAPDGRHAPPAHVGRRAPIRAT